MRKASLEAHLLNLEHCFAGSSAVIFVKEDLIGACKVLKEFRKEHTQVEVKGGILGDRVLSAADIEELASLPGKDVLLAKLLFLLRVYQDPFR
jgi:large subunit ribosomal protein L10